MVRLFSLYFFLISLLAISLVSFYSNLGTNNLLMSQIKLKNVATLLANHILVTGAAGTEGLVEKAHQGRGMLSFGINLMGIPEIKD